MSDDFHPLSEEHLVEVVAQAVGGGRPLEVVGLGSKRGLGRPEQTAARLDMSGFAGIRLYEPEELVMTAGPATPLAEVEAALAAEGQQLAFEPPHFGRLYGNATNDGSIGGIFACGLAGPRRFKAGGARDHLLGFRAVSGRAEIFKSGGRVVKNVTGYDLSKLVCGSFGTLAALTEVTFKVLPAPAKTWTVLAYGLEGREATAEMAWAAGSPHEISGIAHLPENVALESEVDLVRDPGHAVTAFRIEGPAPSVEHRVAALKSRLAGRAAVEELHSQRSARFWAEVRDVAPLVGRDGIVWRVSVAPSDGAAVLDAVLGHARGSGYLDGAGGLVWLSLDPALEDGGADLVRRSFRAGHATLIRGPDALRARVPVFQPEAGPVAALSRRIKQGFDPHAVLNPGRMVEGV